jgi:hypothetical protein
LTARGVSWVCAGAIAAATACDASSHGDTPASCFVGDPSASPQLSLVSPAADGTLQPIADGTAVPLIVPSQGGEILPIGVRALNLDGCPLIQSTALIVPDTGAVASLERRPVTLELAGDGWLQPARPQQLGNFSNLPACPIAGLGQAVNGNQYRIDVQVQDPSGRQGEASALVVPTCHDLQAFCQCQCSAQYVLGGGCPAS